MESEIMRRLRGGSSLNESAKVENGETVFSQEPKGYASSLVQMRLQPTTLEKIASIQSLTGMQNRTQIVTSAIALTEEVLKVLKAGGKVLYEHPGGKKEVLKFVGI